MHYLPFGARLNKGILMVTQLTPGSSSYLYSISFRTSSGTALQMPYSFAS